jgi:N-acetylmuramoyl-L-alanine amidase
MPKILIDAGHYSGYNRSNVVPTYFEGDQMWKLQRYLTNALKAYGFTVGSTKSSINGYPKRNGQDDVYKRGQMAKGYDLMISLHSNACGTESVNRAVIIYPMSGAKNDLTAQLGQCVKSTMNLSSYQLMQRDYNTGTMYSGVKSAQKDYYGVIRGSVAQGVPCVIIEHGFHTNTAVARWLMDDNNLKKLAEAEAKVIAEHFGIKKQTSTSTTQNTTKNNEYYKVQVLAGKNRQSAEDMVNKLKKAGFNGFIVTP